MPRSYSLFLIAMLFGGGWYFTTGPGAGKLGQILNTAQQQGGFGQSAPAGNYPPQYVAAISGRAGRRLVCHLSAAGHAAADANAGRAGDSHRVVQHPGVRRLEGRRTSP